jgi:energy-coupling factor transport system permease protein
VTARLPRGLHPGAWWLWALGLATAASRTTNPLLLGLVLAVAGFVVVSRREDAPWAQSYAVFLRLGLVVIAIRVVAHALFAPSTPGHVIVTLPSVTLPDWMAGVRLGGPVTVETLVAAAYDGLRLATMLACLGAANALANPKRLLKAMPGALYEAGVAVVVAMSVTPQLVGSVGRVREARRLRGRPYRGIRGLRGLAMPVLQGALDRAVMLAAAMDSRGYGRAAHRSRRLRRATAVLTLTGLVGVCLGLYGVLDPSRTGAAGLPVLVVGVLLAVGGLVLGGRRVERTRYRPDPWSWPEWVVGATGVLAGAVLWVAAGRDPALNPTVSPWVWPTLPLVPTAALLVALLPAWVAPPLPRPSAPAEPAAADRAAPRPTGVAA